MSLADAFDAPIVETVGGKTYSLPIFTLDDIAAFSRELLNEQCEKDISRLPITDTVGKDNVRAYYAAAEMDIDELCKLARTLPGARRFLLRSYILGNYPAEAFPQFIKDIATERGFRGIVNMGMSVSRLWPKPKEPALPNGNAASGQKTADAEAASNTTGDSTASS